MGKKVAVDFTAFNYGYVSPKLRGRVDLDFYNQCLDYLLNYIVTPQGELQYRHGSIFVASTRGNKTARLVPFLYNTEQAYIIEITDKKMRFYKDHGLITATAQNITAITQANPAVLTYSGADTYANGDPIYISGVVGMHQLNGREFKVANVNTGANTFELQDFDGNNINSTSYGAYTSGGTVAEIIEINTPYDEADLFELDYTQTNDTMYIAHKDHAPGKLTRTSHTVWTLATYTITANPFASAAQAITAATAANPVVVTYAGADTYANGDTVYFSDIVGMTQLNGVKGVVANVNTGANTFEISGLNGSAFTAYASGGFVQEYINYPSCVTLYEGRLVFAASDSFPTRLWFSKAGSIDDLTTGTNADDGMIFTLRSDQANRIRWLAGAEDYLAVGTSGSEYRVSGGGENDAITPTNISVKPVSFNGVSTARPIRLDSYIMNVQRNGKTVRSFEYDALQDGYTSPDRTLLADHITGSSKFKQLSYTAGSPNIIWGCLNDGKFVGLTFDPKQQVIAWHRHAMASASVLSVSTIPEANDDDELWCVSQRTVNGATVRYVEYFPAPTVMPVFEDYFTGEDNEEDDTEDFLTAVWQAQKTLIHADSAIVYDGRDAATVSVTITGSLTEGSIVSVEASSPFWTSSMVGRRIQSPEGGAIEITSLASTTIVAGVVRYDMEAATFAAGVWYLTAVTITGCWHLEAKAVSILADGGIIEGKTISNGAVTIDDDAGYIIIGLGYNGIGKTQDAEGGGENGRAQTKTRIINSLGIRLRMSIGTKFGTSLYNMEDPPYRPAGEVAGRPPRLVDGIIQVNAPDGWTENKPIYFLHNRPTPSNLQYIMAHMETND